MPICTGLTASRGSPIRWLPARRRRCHRRGMNTSRLRITSFRRSASLALLAVMATSVLGVANVAAVATDSSTPMVLQNISLADVVANKGGICNGGFNMVMKTASGPNNAINYLNAAQRCGLKVIMSFPDVVNYTTGRVYPSKVPYWVNLVKNHPALYGYLTVKEPSWNAHLGGRDPLALQRLPQGRPDPSRRRDVRRHPRTSTSPSIRRPRGWPTSSWSTGTRSRPRATAARDRHALRDRPGRSGIRPRSGQRRRQQDARDARSG